MAAPGSISKLLSGRDGDSPVVHGWPKRRVIEWLAENRDRLTADGWSSDRIVATSLANSSSALLNLLLILDLGGVGVV